MPAQIRNRYVALLAGGGALLVVASVILLLIRPWDEDSSAAQDRDVAAADTPDAANAADATSTPTATSSAETAVDGTVAEDGLELRHPDGAVLDIGPQALPPGTEVSLASATPRELSQLGGLQLDGTAWSITADADPSEPVQFTIPYDPALVPDGARPLFATFDELTGLWLPGETTVAESGELLTTELASFSFKTWINDRVEDLSGSASWLEYQLGNLLGNRADRPDCSASPQPGWVVDVLTVEDDNAQLFACVSAEGDGFAINAVNNRGYPVALEMSRPFTEARPAGVPSDLSSLIAHLVATSGQNRVPLSPTGGAIVSYDPVDTPDGHMDGHVHRDTSALLMFLTVELARGVGVDIPLPGGQELGLWNLECYAQMFSATGDLVDNDVLSAATQLTGCFQNTLEHELGAWDFDPGDNFGDRLWDDVSNLPTGAQNMVKGLRILRSLDVAKWALTAADLFINDSGPSADLVDVGIRWERAPAWGAGGEGGLYLHTLPADVNAPGRSGYHTAIDLDGSTYPQSTSAWVGCESSPATLTYDLNGEYRRLTSTIGLAPHTPDSVSTQVTLVGDGVELDEVTVTTATTAPLGVDLTGVDELVVEALRVAGDCTVSPTPYGVLGDAYLLPVSGTKLAQLPDRFTGSWSGQMTQPSSSRSPYSMDVDLRAGQVDTVVGDVRYDDLECGGDLTLVRAESNRVVVAESISYGAADCVNHGYMVIQTAPEGDLYFEWFEDLDGIAGQPNSWATLSPG